MDIVKKIANYTYNERHCLGQGSFGRVYEGRSDEGLKVAIKRVQQSMISKDPYLRSSLQTQINIMKKLNHPNIIKLYDVVTTANSIYLIMQYCAGGDLKRFCRTRKLTQEQATMIIKNIAKGFQQIVQQGIIHRDLKPANILVHQGVFKICDFGFAKFFNDASRMTRTCVGTPIYMSPQVLAQKSYTDKADVWSLGVLYYQLLFGKLPYYGVTEDALFKNIIKTPLTIPSCTTFTSTLLKGMLQIEQSKRFSWNKIFQMFNFIPSSAQGQLGQGQGQGQGQNNMVFYKQPEIKKEISNRNQEEFLGNGYREFGDRKMERNQRNDKIDRNGNYGDDYEDRNKVVPQRKPKNPLAFQNPVPILNQNQNPQPPQPIQQKKQPPLVPNPPIQQIQPQITPNLPIIKAKPTLPPVSPPQPQNPRFLYFLLIQLITQPAKQSPSYPQLISTLYKKCLELYQKKIQKEGSGTLFGKVLGNQYEELKCIEAEIPSFGGSLDLEKCAEVVLREVNQSGVSNARTVGWVQKIVNKNYSLN